MRAARLHRHGGPEVIVTESIAAPAQHSRVVIDIAYAGINFVDAYQREGRYPGLELPLTLGIEAAGRVAYAPPGSRFSVGDRVACAALGQGCYAEQIALPEGALVAVPEDISLRDAATVLEQGMTADMLLRDVATVTPERPGWALVHAGTSGVGRWLVPQLVARGVPVIALASTAEKRAWLEQSGATALSSNDPQWPALACEAAGHDGLRWIFDSIGAATFDQSLAALAPCGHLILYGAASGPVAPVDPLRLMAKSATLSRPTLPHFLRDPLRLAERAERVFAQLRQSPTLAQVAGVFALEEAAAAHLELASRQRQGKLLLHIGAAQ
ncbi:alcohol dehydrogenase catalytic domain-containing protein [Chitinimonas lacunae]|uniref:Alcohol dehydrogenase catalytic domain-containing protein n=1 Tax=Chitinimonas lacunae TaxID=1963018 RepID=A0ABV8MRC4_9NEIS